MGESSDPYLSLAEPWQIHVKPCIFCWLKHVETIFYRNVVMLGEFLLVSLDSFYYPDWLLRVCWWSQIQVDEIHNSAGSTAISNAPSGNPESNKIHHLYSSMNFLKGFTSRVWLEGKSISLQMKVKVKVLQIPTVFAGWAATEDGAGDALRKAVVVVHVETWTTNK